nr:hypothetical protein CFP56_50506 [Quercus suber]
MDDNSEEETGETPASRHPSTNHAEPLKISVLSSRVGYGRSLTAAYARDRFETLARFVRHFWRAKGSLPSPRRVGVGNSRWLSYRVSWVVFVRNVRIVVEIGMREDMKSRADRYAGWGLSTVRIWLGFNVQRQFMGMMYGQSWSDMKASDANGGSLFGCWSRQWRPRRRLESARGKAQDAIDGDPGVPGHRRSNGGCGRSSVGLLPARQAATYCIARGEARLMLTAARLRPSLGFVKFTINTMSKAVQMGAGITQVQATRPEWARQVEDSITNMYCTYSNRLKSGPSACARRMKRNWFGKVLQIRSQQASGTRRARRGSTVR